MPRRMKKMFKRGRTWKGRGGASGSYSLGAAVAPQAPYAQAVIPGEACDATSQRFGAISGYTPPGNGGLPGYSAYGGRRSRRSRGSMGYGSFTRKFKNFSKKMMKSLRNKMWRGGRYGTDVAGVTTGPNPIVPIVRGGCEGGAVTAPLPVPPSSQTGGAATPLTSAYYAQPIGNPDSAAYAAPTAGYANAPSSWVSSTGTPSLVQIPYEARSMNQACLHTGGGKRSKRSNRSKGSKRSKRTRKH